MSRIGKNPITVPGGVNITLDGSRVTVKGPKGELTRVFPADMIISQESGTVTVNPPRDDPKHKALHGLSPALLANMVEGVTKGFSKQLDIVGVGYKAETRPYGFHFAIVFLTP